MSDESFRSIPNLYIVQSNEGAWRELKDLLCRVVKEARAGNGISFTLKEELYKCTQRQWKDGNFPLGSDGLPPRPTAYSSEKYEDDQRLLKDAIAALLSDLEEGVENNQSFSAWQANRLHMPLTWLFTACPERTVKILLDAIVNPAGPAGRVLHIRNDYSAWSIYSGVGRAAHNEESLRVIFDTLIKSWENGKSPSQDKFLLATVTYPMASRVAARRVLGECKERFEWVKCFLRQHLENLLAGNHDPRPQGRRPSLELRYITMGFRGLCQIRYAKPDWFDAAGKEAGELYTMLRDAREMGGDFEKKLVDLTAPYLIGNGKDPSMPGGF